MPTIISASRRTDIPAFYTRWFIHRIRAGFCEVPNPFNTKQVSRVSLLPEDVAVIVFWTRNPRPLFPYLDELQDRGFRFYFQFTLLSYPRSIDPKVPSLEVALETFQELTSKVGAERVIWRYDPLLFTNVTPPSFHAETFAKITKALRGNTKRCVISLVEPYPKAVQRLAQLAPQGIQWVNLPETDPSTFEGLIQEMVGIASANGIEIQSCATAYDLQNLGVQPGKCIDDDLIQRVFGLEVVHTKDPNQRKACGCVISKDIGAYDTCLYNCIYCYATNSFVRAQNRHARHDPDAPALIMP